MIVRVVTVVAGSSHSACLTSLVRLTRFAGRSGAGVWARVTVCAFASLMRTGREGGFSTAWTAPPPMIAPPQVQAHSFAKAIRTDMTSTLF